MKKLFIEKLQEQGGLALNLVPHIKTKDVNKSWLVNMLYVIDNQLEIFESSYKAPSRAKVKEKNEQDDKYEAYRGAFFGLPLPSKKNLAKKATVGGSLRREKKLTKV